MRKYESYKCLKCGNEVEVQNVGNGTLVCCGQDMNCITENLTMVNLMKAFSGESQARNKYEYFAKVAQKEGFRDIAEHFQRAANNEIQHAKMEFALCNRMSGKDSFGDTKENLIDAAKGENYESSTMYPDFATIAKEESHHEAARLFKSIGKIEVEHENMYNMLLKRLESGGEHVSEDSNEAWICEVCGHVHYGKKALEMCPVCNHDKKYQSRLNSKK
ncbi:MAG: desulfoferrodoxin FeS4 iron-binding domain-containing protein [Sulfurospirillum sp.]|nr:desulfoferrodoxin FeS4 iron-binding domain-containing protein [Sulfurospirillum sp.]MBL0703115.1 desulfoferrodoxin FeS4 iron-binding domain-containing protein [Sulfurospirillum sp.]